MRTQSRLRRFTPFLAIAALLAGVATDAFAQETRKETPAAGKDGRAAATPSPTYDLEIKDGLLVWTGPPRKDNTKQVPANLANVVDLLRELHPEANFAVSPTLADTDLAYLKMRASSVEEKLEAIRIASGSAFLWRNAQATPIDPKTGLPIAAGNQSSPPLYVLDALPEEAKPSLQVEAFNISTYLGSLDSLSGKGTEEWTKRMEKLREQRVEEIQRLAAETVNDYETVSMTLNKSKARSLRSPSIRFHPGANLIVIIGEPEAVAVAAKVIGALPGAQRSVAASVAKTPVLHESQMSRPAPQR